MSFDEFYEKSQAGMRAWAITMCHQAGLEADDLLQDAWLRAFRFWDTCKEENGYMSRVAWMRRIILREVYSALRRITVKEEGLEEDVELERSARMTVPSHYDQIEARLLLEYGLSKMRSFWRERYQMLLAGHATDRKTRVTFCRMRQILKQKIALGCVPLKTHRPDRQR